MARCSCSKCTQKRNLDRFGPEHVAWMRGYAKALRMVGVPLHFPQADQIDREYGTGR